MESGLDGKTALVTGAAGGIGRACAAAFRGRGCATSSAPTSTRRRPTMTASQSADSRDGDVTSDDRTRTGCRGDGEPGRGRRRHGPRHLPVRRPLADIDPAEWDRIQAVNLRGTFLVCQAALRGDGPTRSGLDRHDRLARRPGRRAPRRCGLRCVEGRRRCVHEVARALGSGPGDPRQLREPGLHRHVDDGDWSDDARRDGRERARPSAASAADGGRRAVIWLASDRAAFVHGAHLDVNGGLHMD